MIFQENFCRNVRYLRQKHGLTQRQMAAILGISVSTLRRMEAGAPGVRAHCGMLRRLCGYFGLSADAVLEGIVK